MGQLPRGVVTVLPRKWPDHCPVWEKREHAESKCQRLWDPGPTGLPEAAERKKWSRLYCPSENVLFLFLERICQGVRTLVLDEGAWIAVEKALAQELGELGHSC
jgi:hypothetical protein